ncbi:IS3 family transposase, partial [Flammeovirga aprica]|uniref:IS3 family transposase n=1 Tax=Flammeovirga aprica TaxID=29528 RepID=UPI00293BE6AB
MKEHSHEFSVESMCEVLEISSSAYYSWRQEKVSKRKIAFERDTKHVLKEYHLSKKRYGSYKITSSLKEKGIQTSRNRVARIMKKENIKSCICKSYKPQTTQSNHGKKVAPNILNRNFKTDAPAKAWVSDLTYIPTDQGWLYLTMILDLFDHSIVGWSMSEDMTAENTVLKAWKMAKINRKPEKGMIFHSDQGVQYIAENFQKDLRKNHVI